MLTIKKIIKTLDNPHVQLYHDKSKGYYYFEYSDEKNNIFESESVMTYRLNFLTLEQWLEIGNHFIKDTEEKTEYWDSVKKNNACFPIPCCTLRK